MKSYYIITSNKKEEVLATTNINECFDFIKKHKDSKVWLMDFTGKPKIYNKWNFIEKYLELTGEQQRAFQMAEIMIKGKNNLNYFLHKNNLKNDYDKYKEITSKFL